MLNLDQPLPADLREVLNLYRQARAVRLAMSKEVDKVEEFEKRCKEALIGGIPKDGDGIVANGYACRVTTKETATVKDFDAFIRHVFTTGQTDLLQKSCAARAVKDRWEAGETIPGVERFHSPDLSVTKL